MSAWVLLRGLTRDSRHWGDFSDALRRALPGDSVLPIDLPGNGALNQLSSPLSVAAMTEHCRQQLRERAINTPVCLLAMSLGAMVAMDWATRYPQEIARAVLINTSMRGLSPFYRRLRPANYAILLHCVLPGASGEDRERTILHLTARHPADAEQVVQDWLRYRVERPVTRLNALRQLLAAARFTLPAARPECPLLLLAAGCDALVDANCSRALAARWRCEIAWHPSAGHDIALDDPAWVVRTVEKWAKP